MGCVVDDKRKDRTSRVASALKITQFEVGLRIEEF